MDGRLKTTVRQLREGSFISLVLALDDRSWVFSNDNPHESVWLDVVCVEPCEVCKGVLTSSSGSTGLCLPCLKVKEPRYDAHK